MLLASLRAASVSFSYTSVCFLFWSTKYAASYFELYILSLINNSTGGTEWGTLVQPLKKPTANGNKYSSAAIEILQKTGTSITYFSNMFSP